MSLKGKVAWITGGGSGIGLAGALELARAGAHVVISGRTAATNASALKQLQAAGSAEALQLEVSDNKAVLQAAADILQRHQRIDILINSAGTNLSRQRDLANVPAEGWDEVVAINLNGLFYCCRAVLPAMRKQKDGLVINVSSWAGRYPSTLTGAAYNASKRAVIAISETINAEECMHGIRATSVLPGEVATPLLERRPVPPSKQDRERMLQSEEMGQTLLYLCLLPARACVNELVITPTWNRFYVGGLEKAKS
jgi:NAD(P)-dependent dehydrogenase (short-subunit alcohol dehydrogenase family)